MQPELSYGALAPLEARVECFLEFEGHDVVEAVIEVKTDNNRQLLDSLSETRHRLFTPRLVVGESELFEVWV